MGDGHVIGITRARDYTRLHVQGTGCEKNDTRTVRVVEGRRRIALGDSVWWHCGKVYWSPWWSKQRDIPLQCVEHS